MSLATFLRQVVEILEDAGIPYMLTGSLASAFYATPRATQDIDLVIDADAEALDRAIVGFDGAGPFSRREFERRQTVSLLGMDVSLASLEDVLLAKLEWSKLGDSELQRRDVVQLLERAGARLDLPYVEHWVTQLGLSQEWEEAKKRLT